MLENAVLFKQRKPIKLPLRFRYIVVHGRDFYSQPEITAHSPLCKNSQAEMDHQLRFTEGEGLEMYISTEDEIWEVVIETMLSG